MTAHHDALQTLLKAALESPGLLPPNEFNLARYSLYQHTRNRLLDPDILALEDYFIDHIGLPDADLNAELLGAFGDAVHAICAADDTALRLGYQHMWWLLMWLNIHHPPSFFGEDPDSPLQALQMAAAVGLGEWAAAYHHIEEGLTVLFEQANSPLPRVQRIAALGLERLLRRTWAPTQRRLRYMALAANAPEWRLIVTANSRALYSGTTQPPSALVDVLDIMQRALRYVWSQTVVDDALRATLQEALVHVVPSDAPSVFLQMATWARWPSEDVRWIIRAVLEDLYADPQWAEGAAWVAGYLAD
ncbi:MAG: hypothetical protein ACLFTK_03240 [Anaerolineales bacterium]